MEDEIVVTGLAQIENGAREGSPVMLKDMARVLRVRMEDLVAYSASKPVKFL
ncbi:MAG TPA: hypothetical protein VME47_05755 [Acetobacteraceae bacterium]|nr:hypothetical protein [Acetobacteraceae bacterium]HUN39849.1 hypothetical protein [Acetobacteraceae bacterium]